MKAKKVIFSFIILFLVILLIPSLFPSNFQGLLQPLGVGKEGVLILGGANPEVKEIYLDDDLCPIPGDPSSAPFVPSILPTEANRVPITIKAWIFDINGDCNLATSVTAYLCTADPAPTAHPTCNSGTGDHSPIIMSLVSGEWDGQNCNYTGGVPSYQVEYWERWGNWSINVTVFDNNDLANDSVGYWYYTPYVLGEYPSPDRGTIDLGAVSAGIWNEGTAQYKFNNTGNIRINATWNATDFINLTIPADIQIDGTNFCLDRDVSQADGCDYIHDSEWITIESYPTDGVHRCGIFDCSLDEDGAANDAFYDIYWHINIPAGKPAGLYNNTIEYLLREYEGIGF